ncbi:MAG: MCP four helix bundle domain-containing protein [Minicystis sp.]
MLILLGVLLNNQWERHNIQQWDASFSSIYDDRLVPATYVFKLTDQLYQKRLLWMEAQRPGRTEAVRAALDKHDTAVEALVREFEATYLVEAESQALSRFKARWAACRVLEREWISETSAERLVAMTAEFDQALEQLNLLSRIQEQVGYDLKKGSQSRLASSGILYQLEMALLIVMALLIQFLVPGTAAVPSPPIEQPRSRGSHLH